MTWTPLVTVGVTLLGVSLVTGFACGVSLAWRPDGDLSDYMIKGRLAKRSRYTDLEWRLWKASRYTRWLGFALFVVGGSTGW